MINVTKPFLPPLEDYTKYLSQIWDSSILTNQGPLSLELENKLQDYLKVKNLLLTSNGTIALQIAIKSLKLDKEVITTPFSYVATTNSLIWENCTPRFADIHPSSLCIDPEKIESLITEKTSGILATHIYGMPCDFDSINTLAKKYNLKVIYDGAHAFGVKYKGQSVLHFGHASILSLHATKLFHTVEGGCLITKDEELRHQMKLMRSFGHVGDDYFCSGINGKNSEIHAAMGLCNLPYISSSVARRKEINDFYRQELKNLPLTFLMIPTSIEYNYPYFPVFFKSENELIKVKNYLATSGINSRRYFYPVLNQLSFLNIKDPCPIAEDISKKVLCLPFYQQLSDDEIYHISKMIKMAFKN
jgi:dTDP-4-amino-4,6-dideoxygalactose transaminase